MVVTRRQAKSLSPDKDPYPPVTIISPSPGVSVSYPSSSFLSTTPSKRKKRSNTLSFHRVGASIQNRDSLLLLIIPTLLFVLFIFYKMVDWTFLGGVFMIGLHDKHSNKITASVRRKEVTVGKTTYTIQPKPKDWEQYTYDDIREHFNCRMRSKDNNKPLPSIDDWTLIRQTYTEVVDSTKNWDEDVVPPTLGYSLRPDVSVPPPYYAMFSPGKGRGLFASRFIKKGELVHDGTVSDVVFASGMAWRTFVFSLPRNFACDCTDWHWMQKLEEDGPYFMVAGINISSFMNSGGKEYGIDDEDGSRTPNALPETPYDGKFYALRDIEAGQEILTDYDMYYTKWSLVGL